ncbi:MAG: Uncharacterized protein XD63_1553 [Thermoanaerobacterales bacterium 50_218]|nr:MAG: Uncharacterized protein XD63_1553 [Thermoanaerobacterales bacterium 50_218]HAA89663.1 hypothetical protein [Peptococcaceae bacterium]
MFEFATLLAAFGGGIFGAALGGLFAFIFTGILVLAGVAAGFFGSPEATAILNNLAFGAAFGPQTSFVGGVAAAAYAGRKGLLETGKDIITPLVKFGDPLTLLIGGVFGVIGQLLLILFNKLGVPCDNVALAVVAGNIVARLVWGNGIIGKVPENVKFLTTTDSCVWLPGQKDVLPLLILGFGIGAISAYAAKVTSSAVLPFGVAAVSLIVLEFMGSGLVFHHMAWPAAAATSASGNLLIGILFGIIGALLGELFARIFYIYGDTHIDPPACAIASSITLILLLIGPIG